MDIGKRQWTIYIHSETSTDNGDGTYATGFTESTTPVFASRKPISQRRILENGGVGLEGSVTFNILKNDFPALSKTNIIQLGNDIYTIHSVIEMSNQKELEIIGILKK